MKNIFTFLLLSPCFLCAQNVEVISNGSFEILDSLQSPDPQCPGSGGEISISLGWSTAKGSVDYYNACSNSIYPDYGTPNNRLGFQLPRTGNAYASLLCYIDAWTNEREYLWGELSSPLIANQKYYLEYYVNLSDSSNFAISNFGAHVSVNDTRYLSSGGFLNLESSIHFDTTSAIKDTDGWTKISGTFIAEGGEQYLTLSTFGLDSDDPHIERVANNNPDKWDEAMYLIDDVSLTPVSEVGITETVKVETTIYPNPSPDGAVTLSYRAEDGSRFNWEISDLAGHVVHSQQLSGNEGKATLNKTLSPGLYLSSVVVDGVRYASTRLVIL
ncbi:MAG: T9SS type A sorting domain-containing protein [Flavobacteriales bacterium]|nr:T9SS type A sorting domain-containing protein [Flavobacteriales bacterium]